MGGQFNIKVKDRQKQGERFFKN